MLKKLCILCLMGLLLFTLGCEASSDDSSDDKLGGAINYPAVLSTLPSNNASGVALNAKITISFSKDMDRSTINNSSIDMSGKSISVTYSNRVVTITPSADLSYNTTYSITVYNVVKDMDGNSLENNYSFSFKTIENPDTIAPTVVSTTPNNNDDTVAKNTTIQITFSEDMNESTIISGNFDLNQQGTTANYSEQSVTYENKVASLKYSLSSDTTYTLTIKTGIKDLAGNPLASEYSFTFTTQELKYEYPIVSSIIPAKDAINVSPDTAIQLTFSDDMDVDTITADNFKVYKYFGNVPIAGTISYDNKVLTFTPDSLLDVDAKYTINASYEIVDLDGNSLVTYTTESYAYGYSTNFTTTSLDTTFDSDGIASVSIGSSHDESNAIALQSDGKIIIVGNSGTIDSDFAIARLNSNGSLDTTFNGTGTKTVDFGNGHDVAHAVTVLPGGSILVAGYAYNGTNNDFALVKLNSNGYIDTSFGTSGKIISPIGSSDDIARDMAIDSSGRIILAGYSSNGSNWDFAIARYLSNGTLDNTFGSSGKTITDYNSRENKLYDMALQSDGKIVAVGFTNNGATDNNFTVVRYTTSGSIDTTFGSSGFAIFELNSSGNTADAARAVAIQSNGKIVAGGFYNNGSNHATILRLHENGNIDNSFSTDGIVSITDVSEVLAIAIGNDGTIYAGGFYGSLIHDTCVMHINSDGSFDDTYNFDGVLFKSLSTGDDEIHDMIIQSDGMILTTGFHDVNNYHKMFVARYWY